MTRVKLGQELEVEREEDGEYIIRFKVPRVKLGSDLTGNHLKKS